MASPFDDWKDLAQHKPDSSALQTARTSRGHSFVDAQVQRMADAKADKVNIDHYKIEVLKFPSGMGEMDLFERVRIDLASFLDTSIATFSAFSSGDDSDWSASGTAELGILMLFKISVFGPLHEQAAVVASKSSSKSWVFSPVTIGIAAPGEHPVSGNREFGIETGGSGRDVLATLYTRAVDRAIDTFPDPDTVVYPGGHDLWVSFQNLTKKFIVDKGGDARIVTPETHKPGWTDPELQAIL
jgi:hypothetical protein